MFPVTSSRASPLTREPLTFTKAYLVATEEELAKTTNYKEFFYNMCMRFPEAQLIFLSNDMNSSVFLGGREWNWSDMDD